MLSQAGLAGWRLVTGAFKVRIQTISVLKATWKFSAPEARMPGSQQQERRLEGGRRGDRCSAFVASLLRDSPTFASGPCHLSCGSHRVA